MIVRPATAEDAPKLSEVLQTLVAAGTRRSPADPDFVLGHYIAAPAGIRCSVAIDTDGQHTDGQATDGQDAVGRILGFQSLKRAEAGNPYDTPIGWGIIGTHVRPDAARRGVGRALFASTLDAAQAAGLPAIEAYISATNAGAIAYYGSLGFETYRPVDGVDCRRLLVTPL